MNPAEARDLVRKALFNPVKDETTYVTLLSQLKSLGPQILTSSGMFLMSEWLASKAGLGREEDRPPFLPKMELGLKVAGESIEPPENLLEMQKMRAMETGMREIEERKTRGVLRSLLSKRQIEPSRE